MNNENMINEALYDTCQLIKQGVNNPLDIIKTKYSDKELSMSEGQWNAYYQDLPSYILENAENERTLESFLCYYSVLGDSLLKTAAINEDVPIEYVALVLKKQKEELLKIACVQKSTDLLNYLLEQAISLVNMKLFDDSYPIHYAMQFGSEDIINTLLHFGAIIEVEDNNGQNVLHYLAKNKSKYVWTRYSNDPRFIKLLKRPDKTGFIPIESKEDKKDD